MTTPEPDRRWRHLPGCFGCGTSESSLGIVFEHLAGSVRARATFDGRHVGAPGMVHGGVIMTLLDEAMGSVAATGGRQRVTASISVDFRRPVLLGRPVIAEALITETVERGYLVEAMLAHEDEPHLIRASATARFVLMSG